MLEAILELIAEVLLDGLGQALLEGLLDLGWGTVRGDRPRRRRPHPLVSATVLLIAGAALGAILSSVMPTPTSGLQCRMPPAQDPPRALRLTLELWDAGISLMRQNLRRRHATADESEVERLLIGWLWERPGAEHGDSPGRPVEIAARLG